MLRPYWSPRSARGALAAALALGLLAAACVDPGDPGVRINPLSAELVFGVKDADGAAEDDQLGDLPLAAPLPEEIIEELPEELEPPPLRTPRRPGFDIPLFVDDDEPQEAKPFVCYPYYTRPAPRGEPRAVIGGRPPQGMVRWNGIEVAGTGGKVSWNGIEIPGSQQTEFAPNRRLIRNFKAITPGTIDEVNDAIQDSPANQAEPPEVGSGEFTFETVQPFGEHFLKSSFLVGQPFVTPNALQNAFRVSTAIPRPRQPEAGILVTRTEVVDVNDKPVGGFAPFAPTVGLMLLPLPATASEEFVSVAVDATSGKTVQHSGKVNGIQRVNACGEPIDGWSVTIGVLVSTAGETYDDAQGNPCITKNSTTENASYPKCFAYDIVVAPQHGGILIAEAVRRTPAQGVPVQGQSFTPVPQVGCGQLSNPTPSTVPGGGPAPTTPSSLPPTPSTVPCAQGPTVTTPSATVIPPDVGTTVTVQRTIGQLDPAPPAGSFEGLRSA